jgi:uncharacterized protein (TIGR00369 family)
METAAPLEPKNPDYQARTLKHAENQTFANHLGIEVNTCEPGRVEVQMEPGPSHVSPKHYIHPGIVVTVGSFAATLATLTLLAANEHPEELEMKVDFTRPPRGERLKARARVMDAGRRLSVAEAEVFVTAGTREALVAKLSIIQQVAPGAE